MKMNMKIKKGGYLLLLLTTALLLGCKEDESSDDVSVSDTSTESSEHIQESMFGSDLTITSFEVVESTFSDGSTGDFYQITMLSDGINVDDQIYCPSTSSEYGGLAIYDGSGEPILYPIGEELFDSMETHGYDIVSEDGDVYVFPPSRNSENPDDASVCADLSSKYDLSLTVLIPVNPTNANTPYTIGETEMMGLTLDGIHIVSDPPSVVNGISGMPQESVVVPALDRCGGHADAAGYYHLHFVPEVINQVLENNDITEVSCTLFDQVAEAESKLIGFAKDGFPIYAYETMPEGLDECNGITAVTAEYPEGIYHYVASTTDYLNIPPCLKGKFSRDWITLHD